jgi:hypothetical protein
MFVVVPLQSESVDHIWKKIGNVIASLSFLARCILRRPPYCHNSQMRHYFENSSSP